MTTPEGVVDGYRDTLVGLRGPLLAVLGRWWASLDDDDLAGSFATSAGVAVAAVAATQVRAAALAPAYLAGVLAAAGVDADRQPLAPGAFAGVCTDGRPLTGPLFSGVIETKRRVALGQPLDTARAAGLERIGRAVVTEVTDTSREAFLAAATLDDNVDGYVRRVRLPACGRCLVLGGKRYKLEASFDRHPRCDCVPAPELRGAVAADPPERLFERMTRAEQDNALGLEAAERVRAGADLSTVVNASLRKGGVTAPTPAPRELRARVTPLALRQQAGGDVATYRRLMRERGFLAA